MVEQINLLEVLFTLFEELQDL